MDDETMAAQLIGQLAKRHRIYAAPVQNAPLHAVNVWRHGLARYPSDTAWFDRGKVEWGPTYEHKADGRKLTAEELADKIAATILAEPCRYCGHTDGDPAGSCPA